MNDAAYRVTRRRIFAFVKTWQKRMGLGQWTITVEFCREPAPEMIATTDQLGALMNVNARWQYLTATVRVNMPAVATLSVDEIERTVIHELAHCVVCEMRTDDWHDGNRAHEERVVTMLEKAFFRAHTDGWNAAKDDVRRKARVSATQAKE